MAKLKLHSTYTGNINVLSKLKQTVQCKSNIAKIKVFTILSTNETNVTYHVDVKLRNERGYNG